MMKTQTLPRRKRPDRGTLLTAAVIQLIYGRGFALEQIIPPTSMLFTVLKKGATYALVAVSMNRSTALRGCSRWGRRALCSSARTPMAF